MLLSNNNFKKSNNNKDNKKESNKFTVSLDKILLSLLLTSRKSREYKVSIVLIISWKVMKRWAYCKNVLYFKQVCPVFDK